MTPMKMTAAAHSSWLLWLVVAVATFPALEAFLNGAHRHFQTTRVSSTGSSVRTLTNYQPALAFHRGYQQPLFLAKEEEDSDESAESAEDDESSSTTTSSINTTSTADVEEEDTSSVLKTPSTSNGVAQKETKEEEKEEEASTTSAPTPVSEIEEDEEEEETTAATADDEDEKPPATLEENLRFLASLGAITGRGEFATDEQKQAATSVVEALEAVNPTPLPTESTLQYGRWELTFTSCGQLFRSSPFFMAGRAVCTTDQQRDQYNWFCDMHRAALAISTIGAVRQVVTRTGRLVSEFEVKVGAVPFLNDLTPFSYSGGLPVTIDGALVSSADWTSAENGTAWEIYMDTVEVKGSNLPLLRPILDMPAVQLESRRLADVLEQAVPAYYSTPRPLFTTTYLDETVRISRDQDGSIFVYTKTSDDDSITDYSEKDSDLGFTKLLRGFNDAVTRFYL